MKAFITGMAGFAGAHLAEHCLAAGDDVLGSSLSGDWGDERIAARLPARLLSAAHMLRWDICEQPSAGIVQALRDFAPSVIYHLAAISKADDCADEGVARRVNVGGTRRVLELAWMLPSRPRVVFISSSYVYFQGGRVNERQPLAGMHHPYGATKILGEALTQEFVSQGGDAVIARAFQHAGPRQSPRFMLAEWCEQFARRENLPVVLRKSNAHIDLSDVRDVVRAYRLLAESGKRGEIYNVGSGSEVRTGDLFDRLRQIADPTRPFRVLDESESFGPIADISKITAATGWQPEITLEITIQDAYAWQVDNS